MQLTILMPCLNEVETIGTCVQKALHSLTELGLSGEVLVADNGSTDGSLQIAENLGARVVRVAQKGYGNALRGGIEAAHGEWIIMGDADDSYDFSQLGPFVQKFKQGYELIMGCRMPRGGGNILPGAMPWKNRRIGNPALSIVGRLFFGSAVTDFHCGLRGFTRGAYQKMKLRTSGMEFASEMVIKATLQQIKIIEVPITLHKDGRSRPPHLRPWRDGWRHLRFMLLFSPRWLFLYPGLMLMLLGFGIVVLLLPAPRHLGPVTFDVHTLLHAAMAVLVGFQAVLFAVFTKVFTIAEGLLPPDPRMDRMFKVITLETGLAAGAILVLIGIGGVSAAIYGWQRTSFGPLDPQHTLRTAIPALLALVLGCQTIFASFFLSVLGMKRR